MYSPTLCLRSTVTRISNQVAAGTKDLNICPKLAYFTLVGRYLRKLRHAKTLFVRLKNHPLKYLTPLVRYRYRPNRQPRPFETACLLHHQPGISS